MSAGGYCKDCVSGTIHDGTPTGRTEKLYDLDVYVAEPSSQPKATIVMITDAFGWQLNNNRIMADNLAKKTECKVLMPDFFCGTAADAVLMGHFHTLFDAETSYFSKTVAVFAAAYHFLPFAIYNREGVSKPRVYNFFRRLRHDNPGMKIGAGGWCWGGKWTTYMCAGFNNLNLDPYPSNNIDQPEFSKDKEELLIDAGYTAHPSMLQIPRDVLTLQRPLSIAAATEDFQLSAPKIDEVEKVFDQTNTDRPPCEIVRYEQAKHGFAIRWNPANEREQKQGEEAEEQAVRWFRRFLVGTA
ncbi:MAG: hypothetical protein Q9162_000113 [Coniocarpon cinnabarinum]